MPDKPIILAHYSDLLIGDQQNFSLQTDTIHVLDIIHFCEPAPFTGNAGFFIGNPGRYPGQRKGNPEKSYFYNKAHYWDYTNFKDSTLMRMPLFRSKIDDYFDKMVVGHPDSVYLESVRLIEQVRGCKSMFRYLVSLCFNNILNKKIIGKDRSVSQFAGLFSHEYKK